MSITNIYKIKEIIEKSLILRIMWACKLGLFYTSVWKDEIQTFPYFMCCCSWIIFSISKILQYFIKGVPLGVLLIWIIFEVYEFFWFKSLISSRKCARNIKCKLNFFSTKPESLALWNPGSLTKLTDIHASNNMPTALR